MLLTDDPVKTADAQGSITVSRNEFGLVGVFVMLDYATPLSVTDVIETL